MDDRRVNRADESFRTNGCVIGANEPVIGADGRVIEANGCVIGADENLFNGNLVFFK